MKIDKIENYRAGDRDAVHVPVIYSTFRESKDLIPGQWVKFVDDQLDVVEACLSSEAHGVVSPFIKPRTVKAYGPFPVMINPKHVTKMSHKFELDIDDDDSLHEAWCSNACS